MLGAIVGDIVGSFYELKPNRTTDYNFEMFPRGSMFTDDTTFTLAVADAYLDYLESKSEDKEVYRNILVSKMVEFGEKHNYFSEKMTEWLKNPVPMELSGTGAAIRVSALAHLCDNINELKHIVKISTEVSHNNIEALDSAECVALCVFYLLKGKDKQFIHDFVVLNYYPYLDNYKYEKVKYRYSFYSPSSLHIQTAINCFLESNSFEDCLRKVVSLGGDSDTQAAIAASMAGVFYGIPEYYEKKAFEYLSPDIIAALTRFEKYTMNLCATRDALLDKLLNKEIPLAVIGLGYVGLPIALEFSKHVSVIGFDINENKISSYKNGEFPDDIIFDDIPNCDNIYWTNDEKDIRDAKFIIVAVPTPIDNNKQPDLTLLQNATEIVARNLSKGSIVVYESTVYPGTTEEFCKKILEEISTLQEGIDFYLGYSPERINPGDKDHKLSNIIKIVSGTNSDVVRIIENVYNLIIDAGVYVAPSIKIAESAKIIENCQRDINIAFMNELSMIFESMNIDFKEVLAAASTKWNFLKFHPGLVGGHCIGVDPYYLIHEALNNNITPSLMIKAREINENMVVHISNLIKSKLKKHMISGKAKIGVLGITFKENCKDIRNSKVVDICRAINQHYVMVNDPIVDPIGVKQACGIDLVELNQINELDCLIIAVPHDQYKNLSFQHYASMFNASGPKILIDINGIVDRNACLLYDIDYWRM